MQLRDTVFSSTATECTVCRPAPLLHSLPAPCSRHPPMLGSLSKHHISCQQHCSNASVRFLPSQQNSLVTDHAASWSSSHISCTVFLRQLFRAWEKSETTALLQRQILRVLFVTEKLSSSQSLAGRELFFTFVASYAKQTKSSLAVQCLQIPNHHSVMRQFFCRRISGMWRCIMHGQKYRSAHGGRKKKKVSTHATVC